MKRRLFKEGLKIPYYELEGKYVYAGYPGHTSKEADNFIFKDTLLFTRFSRGRSSVKAEYVSSVTGNEYEMFLSDFEDVLLNNEQSPKSITGEFCFRKAGANFGVVMLED